MPIQRSSSRPVSIARCIVFALLVVASSNLLLSQTVDQGLMPALREGLASVAGALLSVFGFAARVDGTLIALPTGSVRVTSACSGFDAWVCVASAIVVFPARLRAKLQGLAASMLALMLLNFARVLSLAMLVDTSRTLFDWSHYYLWPGLILLSCLATLFAWILWSDSLES